jgi:hypothetical protein
MAKLSSCVYWLSGPEVFCTSTLPVGFSGTPLNGSRGWFIKDAHVLEGSMAQDQNLLKAPLKLCPKIVVAYGRLQPDTTEAFLCNTSTRTDAREGNLGMDLLSQ